jgi:hypothetical protein
MQRRILGISAIVLFLCAVAIWLWRPDEAAMAFCWRGGALLAAAWLAYEDVQRLPNWLLVTVPIVLIAIARWPRLFWLVIPLLILAAVLRGLSRASPPETRR